MKKDRIAKLANAAEAQLALSEQMPDYLADVARQTASAMKRLADISAQYESFHAEAVQKGDHDPVARASRRLGKLRYEREDARAQMFAGILLTSLWATSKPENRLHAVGQLLDLAEMATYDPKKNETLQQSFASNEQLKSFTRISKEVSKKIDKRKDNNPWQIAMRDAVKRVQSLDPLEGVAHVNPKIPEEDKPVIFTRRHLLQGVSSAVAYGAIGGFAAEKIGGAVHHEQRDGYSGALLGGVLAGFSQVILNIMDDKPVGQEEFKRVWKELKKVYPRYCNKLLEEDRAAMVEQYREAKELFAEIETLVHEYPNLLPIMRVDDGATIDTQTFVADAQSMFLRLQILDEAHIQPESMARLLLEAKNQLDQTIFTGSMWNMGFMFEALIEQAPDKAQSRAALEKINEFMGKLVKLSNVMGHVYGTATVMADKGVARQ